MPAAPVQGFLQFASPSRTLMALGPAPYALVPMGQQVLRGPLPSPPGAVGTLWLQLRSHLAGVLTES